MGFYFLSLVTKPGQVCPHPLCLYAKLSLLTVALYLNYRHERIDLPIYSQPAAKQTSLNANLNPSVKDS